MGTGSIRFDAVFACNSFHWVDPRIRFDKSAAVLKPRGHLIVVETPWVIPDHADRFWWDVQDDWAAVGAERVDPASARIGDLGPAVRTSGLFEEPTIERHLFQVTFTAERVRPQSRDPVWRQGVSTRDSRSVRALLPDGRIE